MWFYERDGGQNYPDETPSSYYAYRFFNQGYDHKIDLVSSKCYKVPAPGKYSSQDFKQCVTQACQATTACCQCPGGTGVKGEQKYNGYPIQKVQSSGRCACTPIVIDTSGNGFEFTNASNDVKFDISGRGFPVQMGWTAKGSGNAFLCLPDAMGACPSGRYLFGSAAPQPASNSPNGFLALGVYDDPAHGGNGDGVIDSRDLVFARLRLWIDANHDGVTQPSELFTLPQLGITSISLNYKADQRTDQYGNILRYRAQIGRTDGGTRTAYDVFFVTGGVTTACGTALIPQAKTLN